jgi:hypothetical protein
MALGVVAECHCAVCSGTQRPPLARRRPIERAAVCLEAAFRVAPPTLALEQHRRHLPGRPCPPTAISSPALRQSSRWNSTVGTGTSGPPSASHSAFTDRFRRGCSSGLRVRCQRRRHPTRHVLSAENSPPGLVAATELGGGLRACVDGCPVARFRWVVGLGALLSVCRVVASTEGFGRAGTLRSGWGAGPSARMTRRWIVLGGTADVDSGRAAAGGRKALSSLSLTWVFVGM